MFSFAFPEQRYQDVLGGIAAGGTVTTGSTAQLVVGAVPEPSSLALLAVGVAALAWRGARRRRGGRRA